MYNIVIIKKNRTAKQCGEKKEMCKKRAKLSVHGGGGWS